MKGRASNLPVILKALENAPPEGLSNKAVLDAVHAQLPKLSLPVMQGTLWHYEKAGHVQRVSRGMYRLPAGTVKPTNGAVATRVTRRTVVNVTPAAQATHRALVYLQEIRRDMIEEIKAGDRNTIGKQGALVELAICELRGSRA